MQSLVPACSNISKLIFNNDQALLLLVQNYIQLYNTCADHPNIHQSQKQCQLYEKVRFNSITLSLSSLTKSQKKQSYIQMSYSTTIARLPTPALATMHPSGGFIPYMTLTSFNFLAGDKELRDMPVFLMGDVHGMNG